jgi:hypothetical protein
LTVVEPALLGLLEGVLLWDWPAAVAAVAVVAAVVGDVAVAEDPAVDEGVTPCIHQSATSSAKGVKGYTASLQTCSAVATAVAKSEAEQLFWKHWLVELTNA